MADTTKKTSKATPKDSLALVRDIIKVARQKQGLTQVELTEKGRVIQTAVMRVERTGLIQTDGLFLLFETLGILDPLQNVLKETLSKVSALPDPETPEVAWVKGVKRAR